MRERKGEKEKRRPHTAVDIDHHHTTILSYHPSQHTTLHPPCTNTHVSLYQIRPRPPTTHTQPHTLDSPTTTPHYRHPHLLIRPPPPPSIKPSIKRTPSPPAVKRATSHPRSPPTAFSTARRQRGGGDRGGGGKGGSDGGGGGDGRRRRKDRPSRASGARQTPSHRPSYRRQ